MVVSEGAINNIMGGMENTAGVRLHSHRHKLKQRFDIIRKLGQGTYGKVQLAVNKETGQEVAIKTIKKAKIETEQDLIRIRREIQIMSSVQHPQIIHIYEVFENREKMVLVMEYAAGGELYDYLSERKVLSEDEARRVFRHVASATYYCHKHKICHRDLKLENILLDLDGNAKIADFGLSNVFDDKHRLDTFCGSPLYASPEIVKGIPYTGPEVDCWSLGVLLYTLVYGAMPFDGSNFKRLVKQITQGDYYEPKKPSSASDLIRQMLTVSATKRATIEDICSHWWVNEGYLESCLDVAEALANQTPVRLDLLLSLAPKHINSEHMLIQPEDDDSARSPPTSEMLRPPPQLQLPPPPPPEAMPLPTARSASLGAVTSVGRNEIEALLARKIQEKKEDERKRKAEGSGILEKKKKRESTVEGTPKLSRKERKPDASVHSGDAAISRRPPAGPDNDGGERKKSVKKRDPITDMDTSEREKSERRKSVKKRETLVDDDISDKSDKSERRRSSVKKRESSADKDVSENERTERKKSVKKRDSSLTRESNDDRLERRKSTKKKEPLKEKVPSKLSSDSSTEPSSVINGEKHIGNKSEIRQSVDRVSLEDQTQNTNLNPPQSKDQVLDLVQPLVSNAESEVNECDKNILNDLSQNSNQVESMEVEAVTPTVATLPPVMSAKTSASTRSVGSGASNDGTLKASDSSLSRESVSPLKSEPKTSSSAPTQDIKKSPSPGQALQMRKVKSKSLIKTSSKSKVESPQPEAPAVNGELPDKSGLSTAQNVDETEKVLQETADKIKFAEESNIPIIIKTRDEESLNKEGKTDLQNKENVAVDDKQRKESESLGDSVSSKDASQASSLLSTPARSRAGSESSTEARPTRADSIKRQSKIFKAAAMWEKQSSTSPPPLEKPKKPFRPGGTAMSDLAKKFEEKPAIERKAKVLPTFKVSDARKAFEAKPGDKPTIILRKKSITESLPSSPTTKESPKLPTTQSGPNMPRETTMEATTPSAATSMATTVSSAVAAKPKKDKTPPKETSPIKETANRKAVTEKEKTPKKTKETVKGIPKSKSPKPSSSKTDLKQAETNIKRPMETKVGKEDTVGAVKTSTKDKPSIAVDKKLATPKASSQTLDVPPREAITSSEEEEAVVVGGLDLKLGGVGKISEVGTKQEIQKVESPESSDSESEAEKLLKLLSEKREKVEAARREKLRKVSAAKEKDVKKDMPAIKEEAQKSPPKSPSKAPEAAVTAEPSDTKETGGPEQKFATLPRGFKAKAPAGAASTPPPLPPFEKTKRGDKDKAINEEIEGMMSAIKAVDRAITQVPYGLPQESEESKETDQKKSQVEIVLNKQSEAQEPDLANKRASYAEIKLTSPTAKEAPKPQEFRSEVRHSVGPSPRAGEAQLQRAKRERIIPIMLEDDDDDDDRTTSESLTQNEKPGTTPSASRSGSRMTSPQPVQPLIPRTSHAQSPIRTHTPETIMKSRRERIIPIAVEGEGIVTPPPHIEEAAELGAARAHQAFSRNLASRPNALNRGRGFLLDHSESFSSAGEEEEDEDDGFQILTAESLFSTLLNRVRSLTRKMNADELRGDRGRGPSSQPTPEPFGPPGSAGIGTAHSGSSGFWSSLYNSPRDSPARRISETMSRSSLGRDDEALGGLSSPLWTRSVSRDPSDADTLFSDSSTPFGTLPRGWRTSRWSGPEDGAESDASDASARSLPRRPYYSRAPSRELHNIPDEELGPMGGGRAYPGGGMSLPRPYPGSSSGNVPQGRSMHDSADRIAAMYGTLRSPHRRPHSTVVGPSGEGIGRDGGLCEQQQPVVLDAAAHTGMQTQPCMSQLSPGSPMMAVSPEDTEALKQSVSQQLQQLVRELEAADDQAPLTSLQPQQPSFDQSYQGENCVPQSSTPISSPYIPTHSSNLEKHPNSTVMASSSTPIQSPISPTHFPNTPTRSACTPTYTNIMPDRRTDNIQKTLSGTLIPMEQVVLNNNITTTQQSTINNSNIMGNDLQERSVKSQSSNTLPSSSVISNIGADSRQKTTYSPASRIPVLNSNVDVTNQSNFGKPTSPTNELLGHNVMLDISRDGAISPPSSDGLPEGDSLHRPSTARDEWLQSSGPVVRNTEMTALDAYRKSRGKGDLLENREKHEDIRQAIESLAQFDTPSDNNILGPQSPLPDVSANVTQIDSKLSPTIFNNVVTKADTSNTNLIDKSIMSTSYIDNNNRSVLNTTPKMNANVVTPSTNSIPRVSSTINASHDQNNNDGIPTSRSTSGIPVKSNSRGSISTRSSYSGLSNVSNTKSTEAQSKPYTRTKSRELTPAIEAAGEKFNQLNSGTLKRISPFEAYRRNKSRELPIEAANKEQTITRLKSPPPGPERAKSPFEKARSSIERKFERSKSPLNERPVNRKSELPSGPMRAPVKPNLNRSASLVQARDIEKSQVTDNVQTKESKTNQEKEDKDRSTENSREYENLQNMEMIMEKENDKDRSKIKKTSSCDPEKPKSMYKLLASRFNRSGSNVSDSNTRQTHEKRTDDDDINEKEEKFSLKRPSRFLKTKAEKSSSKSSICEEDGSHISERQDKKPSKKLTDALNKFLGRKDSKGDEARPSTNSAPQLAAPLNPTCDLPKKPPRVKPKKFSKSQENLCLSQTVEEQETGMVSPQVERAQSAVPEGSLPAAPPGFTLESVTKSICDHLSQLESDITSRIGNMGVQESGSVVLRPPGSSRGLPTASSVPSLTKYGLSPALASRRSAKPTNLDIAAAKIDNQNVNESTETKINTTDDATPNTDNHIPTTAGDGVKYAHIKKLGNTESVLSEDESQTPTESGESTTSGLDEHKGQSENDDESVMDRITRKSFYPRFQELKKRPKLRRANTKEDMEQQLAAAKARLMKEDAEKAVRDSLSPLRYISPPTSPRASVNSPPSWDSSRKHSRKSLPPDDLNGNLLLGGRRSTSLQPDDLPGIRRLTYSQPEDDKAVVRRRLSGQQDDHKKSRRAPSVPPGNRVSRMKSTPPEDISPPLHMSSRYSNSHRKSVPPDSKPLPISKEQNDISGEDRVKSAVAAAVAAGAMAGEAAAVVAADGTPEKGSCRSRESSLSRLRSPEPGNRLTPNRDETRNNAREELTRRLTHLTRISGASGISSASKVPTATNKNESGGVRAYRRTNTTGVSGGTTTGLNEKPVYRRTNTMDLPPADARARPGSEYRRQLQDPARRYSAASFGRLGDRGRFTVQETLVEGEALTTPSSRITSSRIASPPLASTSPTYRGIGAVDLARFSAMDTPRYSPTTDPPRYSSTSSTISPLSRRTSFYRY